MYIKNRHHACAQCLCRQKRSVSDHETCRRAVAFVRKVGDDRMDTEHLRSMFRKTISVKIHRVPVANPLLHHDRVSVEHFRSRAHHEEVFRRTYPLRMREKYARTRKRIDLKLTGMKPGARTARRVPPMHHPKLRRKDDNVARLATTQDVKRVERAVTPPKLKIPEVRELVVHRPAELLNLPEDEFDTEAIFLAQGKLVAKEISRDRIDLGHSDPAFEAIGFGVFLLHPLDVAKRRCSRDAENFDENLDLLPQGLETHERRAVFAHRGDTLLILYNCCHS